MAWNEKYWDMICNIFLTPEYMGWKPIKRSAWRVAEDGSVTIDGSAIEKGAHALYSRVPMSDAADIRGRISHKEEILNHIFSLTFAIAGDEIIKTLFCDPLGLADDGPFLSRGREIKQLYELPGNITQQDGLFVSDKSAIGVELKLGSSSSVTQVLKYIMLFLHEEERRKTRLQLGLMFILPRASIEKHWNDVGLRSSHIDASYLDRLAGIKLNKHLELFLKTHRNAFADALDRLKITAVSWNEFDQVMASFQSKLGNAVCGEQTAFRLLDGMRVQIGVHKGTGVVV